MRPEFDIDAVPVDDDLDGSDDLRDLATSPQAEVLESRLAEIERRAATTELPTRRTAHPVDGNLILQISYGPKNLRSGSISVETVERADELLALPFEDYRVVPGYTAIHAMTTGETEAQIRPLGIFPLMGFRDNPPLDKPYDLPGDPRHPNQTIHIGEASKLFSMILFPSRIRGPQPLTVRFRGFSCKTPATAKKVLDEIGSALMFELDLAYGIPLTIAPSREFPRRAQKRVRSEAPPAFPNNAYDPEPVALYMYGREARGMPLLQFLAFYQAVEFYFPRYSDAELRRRLEGIVKDPRFNPHHNRDIERLLGTAIGDGRRGVSNEREQLKATIRACVQADDIKDFVGYDTERADFFADRRSPLTSCAIALRDQTTDLRDATAERIYELRCKIVHTKGGSGQDEIDLLLPNSPEARLLTNDIALLELIATRVIVASSNELRI